MEKQPEKQKGDRIAKIIARAGICSRRDAEKLIDEGRVRVNNAVLKTPAYVVGPGDEIKVDGKPLKTPEKTRLFLFHKPTGLVTTAKDERGRETVFDAMPPELPRLVSVGRLDLNSEGLLLLTNDGGLARHLELPATGWRRKYRVRVLGTPDEGKLAALKKGITIDGIHYKSIEATIEKGEKPGRSNSWLIVTLTEGKNREIRKVMDAIGLKVNRLIRLSYGPFNLDDMPRGAVAEVSQHILRTQIPGYFKTKL